MSTRHAPRTPVDAAHVAVFEAIKAGTLAPAKSHACRVCGRRADVLHHWSYEPEHHLDVAPLCRGCHGAVHSGRVPDPTSGARWKRTLKPRPVTPAVLERRELYGNRLRELREAAGLSLAEAGKASGMSGAGWQNIESGWYGVNEFTLGRMAIALGMGLRLELGAATPSPAPAEVGR